MDSHDECAAAIRAAPPRSAAIPIHPMLIPFPIVCFIGTLVTDIVFFNNHDPGWATASR